MKKTGDIIKEYRLKRNMTLEQFADKLGRSQGYISDIISERKPFPKKELGDKIIEVLNISPEDVGAIKTYEDYKKTPESIKRKLDLYGKLIGLDGLGNFNMKSNYGTTLVSSDGTPLTPPINLKNRLTTTLLGVHKGYDKITESSSRDSFEYMMTFNGDFQNYYFAIEIENDDSMVPLINIGDKVIVNPNETINKTGTAIDLDRIKSYETRKNSGTVSIIPLEETLKKRAEFESEYKEKRKYYVITFNNQTFIKEVISPADNLVILRGFNPKVKDIYIEGNDISKIKTHGRVVKVMSEKDL